MYSIFKCFQQKLFRMFKEYRDYLRLIRFEHSLMVAFTVLVGQAIVEKSVGLHQLLPALGPALITAGAFALNDVFGYASDKANKRVDRPLVAGKISRKNAWLAAIIFYALAYSSTLVNHSAYTIALAFAVFACLRCVFEKFRSQATFLLRQQCPPRFCTLQPQSPARFRVFV